MRLMKAILACVLPAWAAKLPRSDEVKAVLVNLQTGSAGSSCPENQFPVVNLTVEGIGYHEDVLPGAQTQKLQEHLAGHPDWSIGKPWVLSLTAKSSDIKDREFGFAGGEGFMVFKVPRAGRKNIVVTGSVESLAEHTRLEYRGNEVITAPGAIIFTNVCLRPMTCEHFLTQNPSMCKDGLWSPKPHPEKVTGHTRNTCCQKIRCEDAAPCVPQTKYDKRPDYSKTFGSKPDQCCLPKLCTGSVCNSSGWEPKPGFHILGSTLSECCTPRDCDDYTCSARSVKKPKRYDVQGQAILQQGSTDEECCDPISCSHVKCDATDEWARNRSATVGSSLEDCCIPLYCAKHTCEPASQWEKNPHAILGSSNPSCCKPKLCKDFKCEEGFALRAGAVFGQKQLRGSSSEECCEKKLCKNWKCSDPSKWIQKADETSQDIARHGWSDEECCTPISCSSVDCVPESLWSPRPAEELEGVQGSTSEQCCNPRWCADYTCTGDVPQMNISSSKWFKKVDTNHFKFRGSTDEECCHPKYCSEFFTAFPSKYQRKPENQDTPRQGSTEAECYDELKCSDYCCMNEALQLKEDASQILGSTDGECCEPK